MLADMPGHEFPVFLPTLVAAFECSHYYDF